MTAPAVPTVAPEFLTPAQVCDRIPGMTPTQLARHAYQGTGPLFTTVGRKRIYEWGDVVAWMRDNRIARTDRFS